MQKTLEQRFWEKVRPTDACWLWTGKTRGGYGRIQVERRGYYKAAHRVSLQLSGVLVPDESLVCHVCNNPPCVRPEHLYVGDRLTNAADMLQAGTHNQARKVACKRGHIFDEENTYQFRIPRGQGWGRSCRRCRTQWMRDKRAQ